MNEHVRSRDFDYPIRTLDELARHRWTTADLLALQERGQVALDPEYELIDGEIVALPAEGALHSDLRGDLSDFLIRRRPRPDHVRVNPEPQFNLTDKSHVKPDLVVRPAAIPMSALRGPDALLVIEIADSSLDYDMTTKAALYAEHGVREYGVIDARTRSTKVFRGPSASGYTTSTPCAARDRVVPLLAPGLVVCLGDFDIAE